MEIANVGKLFRSKSANWLVSLKLPVALHYCPFCLCWFRLFNIRSAVPYGRTVMMSCVLHFKSHTDGPLKPPRRHQSQLSIRKQEPLTTTLPFQAKDTIRCSFGRFLPFLPLCKKFCVFLKENEPEDRGRPCGRNTHIHRHTDTQRFTKRKYQELFPSQDLRRENSTKTNLVHTCGHTLHPKPTQPTRSRS